jgi:hypothetical protein
MLRRAACLVVMFALGCSKTSGEEKASKDDDEKVEKDTKKKKKASKDDVDELTNEEACKRIGKLALKEKPDTSEEKLEKKTKQCVSKLDDEPKRKKCVVTCLADNDTLTDFEKCERACRDKAKNE